MSDKHTLEQMTAEAHHRRLLADAREVFGDHHAKLGSARCSVSPSSEVTWLAYPTARSSKP